MDICLRVLKESNKSRFDSYNVRNSVLSISHITFRDTVSVYNYKTINNTMLGLTLGNLRDHA